MQQRPSRDANVRSSAREFPFTFFKAKVYHSPHHSTTGPSPDVQILVKDSTYKTSKMNQIHLSCSNPCTDIIILRNNPKDALIYVNPLAPTDIYIYIHTHTHTHTHIYMSYRTANLQTLYFKYLLNKYTY